MKLTVDSPMVEWLSTGRPSLEWDDGNSLKNTKHGVEPAQVESLFGNPLLLAGRILEPAHDEPRWLALGSDDDGRRLALIFTRRGDRLRPISCRPMRRGERREYEKALEDEEQ